MFITSRGSRIHFGTHLLTLVIVMFALSGPILAQAVNGFDIWYVDEPNNTIYKVNQATGALIVSFPVPAAVVTPAGLAVSGVPGGGTNLWLLDSGASLIYKLNPVTGAVQATIPAPSPSSVGLGAACIVPQNVEELFVVANDAAGPGSLYWIQPATGAIINQCTLEVANIRDATAYALGSDGTGVCYLRDLNPGGTQITCVNKLSCAVIWSATYPWEGWGLGNRTEGTVAATATELFASDLGANILHVLDAVDGAAIRQISTVPGVAGADLRGVGGDSSCPPVTVPALVPFGILVLMASIIGLASWLLLWRRT